MKIRLGMIVALVVLGLPIAAQAGPSTRQTVDVTGWNDHIPAPTPDVPRHGFARSHRRRHLDDVPDERAARRRRGDDLVDPSRRFGQPRLRPVRSGPRGQQRWLCKLRRPSRRGRHVWMFPSAVPVCGTQRRARPDGGSARPHPRPQGSRPDSAPDPTSQATSGNAGFEDDLCNATFCQVQAAIFGAP